MSFAEPLVPCDVWGSFTIGGMPFYGPGWSCLDRVTRLWATVAKRGENLIVPLRPGSIGRDKVRAELRFTYDVIVCGACDQSGVPHADQYDGYERNLAAIKAVTDLTTAQTLVVTKAGGSTVSGSVYVMSFDVVEEPTTDLAVARHELVIELPVGVLT